MKPQVEIKLTIHVSPEKVNEITDDLLHVIKMKDVWNGKLEQGRVEIDFNSPLESELNSRAESK